MDKKEKIFSPAIQFNPYNHETDMFDEATFLLGINYQAIYDSYAYQYLCVTGSSANQKFGFITTKNRFVDPVEAMVIFNEQNELKLKHIDLKPEELY